MKKKNVLAIIVEGRFVLEINDKSNYIIISGKEPDEEQMEIGQWLQINYNNPEEILKALELIKIDFGKIDEINIIYNNQKLNMISYQFDYEFLKNLYLNQTANIIYFLSVLIPFFEKDISIKLIHGDFSYYQIHNKNWVIVITNFLRALQKDLESKISISLD
jgi:hypothetical protein